MTSFNPTRRIGGQLAEVARAPPRAAAARRPWPVPSTGCARCGSPSAERRAHQYPHEFSGGMRQRAMIGMGLMGTPALIVADEPTTALDVTVQQQVLDLLAVDPRDRRRRAGADQPRRHRGRRGLRPGAGHVRRPDRRGPARRRAGHRGPAPLHAGAGGRRTRHGHRPRPAAGGHPRPPRRPGRPARRAARTPPAVRSPPRGAAPRTRALVDRRRRPPGRLLARRRADPARDRGPAASSTWRSR